jgi:hypothetical protein
LDGISDQERKLFDGNGGLSEAAVAANIALAAGAMGAEEEYVPYPGLVYREGILTDAEKKKEEEEDNKCFQCKIGQDPELKTENPAYDLIEQVFKEKYGIITNIALGEILHEIFMKNVGRQFPEIDWPAGCIIRHCLGGHKKVLDSSITRRIVGGSLDYGICQISLNGCYVRDKASGKVRVHAKNMELMLKMIKVRFGLKISA